MSVLPHFGQLSEFSPQRGIAGMSFDRCPGSARMRLDGGDPLKSDEASESDKSPASGQQKFPKCVKAIANLAHLELVEGREFGGGARAYG